MTKCLVLRARFGSRIKSRLAGTGLTVDDLAALSRVPVDRLSKIINGIYGRLTIRDMDAIASAFHISLYSLLAPNESADDVD